MSAPATSPSITPRVGVWFVGARGSVATTTTVGAAALAGELTAPTGCVTALPPFRDLSIPAPGDLVLGGHDVSDTPLTKRAEQLVSAGVLPGHLLEQVRGALTAAEQEIRPGVDAGTVRADGTDGAHRRTDADGADTTAGATQAEVIDRLAADLRAFRARHHLEQVVVINLASTEPPPEPDASHGSLTALRTALRAGHAPLPASSLYACAAFEADCAYVNFTPSAGASLPALEELARERGLPHAGRDAKTGETLVKSALAPMFVQRALQVRAWSGTNLLGGGDGETLADPRAARSKTGTKERGLRETFGHPVDGLVHIDHVAEMTEWKTAWDHVLFDGFLGARMTLQFTWQGCDSALAAPLVLDLARLVAFARRRGERGLVTPLGFFFKDPMGSMEHNLTRQFDALAAWALDDARATGDTPSVEDTHAAGGSHPADAT